jgi:hypothetical protein
MCAAMRNTASTGLSCNAADELFFLNPCSWDTIAAATTRHVAGQRRQPAAVAVAAEAGAGDRGRRASRRPSQQPMSQ